MLSGATWQYHATRKHAVTQAGGISLAYQYDSNGNAISRQGLSITWTSYNHPATINGSGGQSVQFSYTHAHERWRSILTSSAGMETTYFIGGSLEKVITAGSTEYRHFIDAGSIRVAVYSRPTTGSPAIRYIREDHLGSVENILNQDGSSYVKTTFDAFGQRRNACTWSGPPTQGAKDKINAVTRHGYTWHTALGEMGLNDMNGRIQDAVTGRFLSPDPFVPDPLNTQSYNRYSYVMNNPLTWIDPSGYEEDAMPTITVTGSRIFPWEDYSFDYFVALLYLNPAGFGVGGADSGDLPEVVVSGTRPQGAAPEPIPAGLQTVAPVQWQSCAISSFEYSQCVAQCNQEHAWIGNIAGGVVGGATYGGLVGLKGGAQTGLLGAAAGAIAGGFGAAVLSAIGNPSAAETALVGSAASAMRNAAMSGNIVAGLAGGVTGGAFNALTGASVSAAVAGASAGVIAGGNLGSSAILGQGAAGAAAGIAALATKSIADSLVNRACESSCRQ